MVRGLYTAATGMIHQQQRLDIISNNLANVNTAGYKKEGTTSESFESILAIKISDSGEAYSQRGIGSMTLGVKIGQVFTDYSQGNLEETASPLHLAIQGQGFFTVEDTDGQGNAVPRYTRDGSFYVSADGYLSTRDGYYVMGQSGRISLSGQDIRIDEDGQIFSGDVYVDTLQLVDFEDNSYLQKIGDNLYHAVDGAVTTEFDGILLQGYLENSNVNSIREMVEMITVSRAYETNQKMIQIQDETLNKAVNENGRV